MRLERRAAVHAALGEPARLAIADALVLGDASPSELGESLRLPSNLLAHHLRVLEAAGVISRSRSEADQRRTYVRLLPGAATMLDPPAAVLAPRVVFVCTSNSARSQLAAAIWAARSRVPSASAGTRPAECVHRRAVSAARRHGLALDPRDTAHVRDTIRPGDLVVAVCDNAHEELGRQPPRLHWSVPDPVLTDTDGAFDRAFEEIQARVERLTTAVDAGRPADRRMP